MIFAVLPLCATSGCVSNNETTVQAILDKPLENDGRILDATIFPYDVGERDQYFICFASCSDSVGGRSSAALDPRIAGEFDGYYGRRPAHV